MMNQMAQQKISEVLKTVKLRFVESNKREEMVDADWLLSNILSCSRSELSLIGDELFPKKLLEKYLDYVKRRLSGEPLQYILQEQSFYGYDFYVDSNVLIPRFETEELVEKAIQIINKNKLRTIIDMCTGSGCIGITIAKECLDVQSVCVDLSSKALDVAKYNADQLDVVDQVAFYKSNLFADIRAMEVDMIISNPPYIESVVIDTLSDEVKCQEPHLALDGGSDGLEFYRRIIKESQHYLMDKGYLLFEIGYNQMEAVIDLMKLNKFVDIVGYQDLSGHDRIVIGRLG